MYRLYHYFPEPLLASYLSNSQLTLPVISALQSPFESILWHATESPNYMD
jgi:hypothetical protein